MRAANAKERKAMAVNVRQRKTPRGIMYWQADIRVQFPDGTHHRERIKAPGKSRAQALRWARQREVHIIRHGVQREERVDRESRSEDRPSAERVPTVREFTPRFMSDHVEANRLAPATRRGYDVALRSHILPVVGDVPLNRIKPRHVQALKRRGLKASTTNLVLKRLKVMLRRAVQWGLLDAVPEIVGIKVGKRQPEFYDFGVYEQLCAAACRRGEDALLIVLLGGDAGLRRGEMRGLRWPNVHLDRGVMYICDNLTQNNLVRLPKGGATRWVPITDPLMATLRACERRGEYVVSRYDGHIMSESMLVRRLKDAQTAAMLPRKGPHILRHTFCSHLAMRGTAQKVIQELAGHAHGSTTEVYMHLAPRALTEAIRGLRAGFWQNTGTARSDEEL